MNSLPKNVDPIVNYHLQIDSLKYKYALESSKIGIWELNLVTNKMSHSKESKAIFGFDDDTLDISDIDWKDRIHPDDLEGLMKIVYQHIEGSTADYRSEHRILCNDGSYKWVLDCGKIIAFDPKGNPTLFIGTTIDISQRMEDEELLKQNLNIITNQNNKLTNFAHIVTHNLKEYAGNFESLLGFYEDSQDETEKNDIISHLNSVSISLTKTIHNLKNIVSKQGHSKIECKSLNLNAFIKNVISLLECEIAQTKAVINNNISDDLFLYSNDAYLESIILNLASNALKYAHPDRTPILNIDAKVSNDQIIISLEDNGIGIDLDKFGNDIFGLYKTFHGNTNAEGIGLYITKNQIEALGATIDLRSEIDKGTTFIITIKTKKNQM